MAEEEIARLTADVNRFALQQGWLPTEPQDSVWETWNVINSAAPRRIPDASSTRPPDMLPVWESCSTILNGLLQNRNAYLFSRPVDPQRDGVPNYFEVVKKPMDLGTVKQKLALNTRRRHEPLKASMYKCPTEFKADMNLIWENCFLYNPPGYEVRDMGAALKAEFERRWKAMRIEETIEGKKSRPKADPPQVDAPRGAKKETGKVLKKRKPGLTEQGSTPGMDKSIPPAIQNSSNERKTDEHNNILHDHVHHPPAKSRKEQGRQGGVAPSTKNNARGTVDSPLNRKKAEQGKNGTKKKPVDAGGQKKGTVPSKKIHRATSQSRKMMKLLQSCKKPALREPQLEIGNKQPPGEWKPPIERGGGGGGDVHVKLPSCKPVERTAVQAPAPPRPAKRLSGSDTLKKCIALNKILKRSLEGLELKSEEQMTDYEVRRRLSLLLESMSQTALSAVVERLIAKDPSFSNGASSIDQLEIKTVRHAIRILLNAAKKKSKPPQQDKEPLPSSEKTMSIAQNASPNPVAIGNPAKKKKLEDEGCRLATKTPMVSPPSPPWHRRLTHKREVWDNAVGLCGVTSRQDGSDLGLTPLQESNESSWEEAIPDDVEDGEILD